MGILKKKSAKKSTKKSAKPTAKQLAALKAGREKLAKERKKAKEEVRKELKKATKSIRKKTSKIVSSARKRVQKETTKTMKATKARLKAKGLAGKKKTLSGNKEKTYKIVARTNGYIASRDILFKGKTQITLVEGLTLKEAQKKLLEFFNEDKETNFKNWGIARRSYPWETSTFKDGTRSYEEDSRYYSIEIED